MSAETLEPSDTALVVAIGRRDDRSLAEVHRRHGGAVLALARRVVRDPVLAEDVAQQVFVRLWQRPERFDPDRASLRTYLLSDTHGRSVDLIRSEEARRRREEHDASDREIQPPPRGLDPETAAQTSLDREAIAKAVASLPDGERQAIELAYFAGRSYREVAELLSTPEGTVKSRIRSGLRRLRGVVTDAGVTL